MSQSQLATTTSKEYAEPHALSSQVISGGLCAIENVWVSGVHSGFKHRNKDLALIYFPKGATMEGCLLKMPSNLIISNMIKND